MRRVALSGLAVATMAVMAGAILLRPNGGATPATAAGGATLSLGTITYDGARIRVPIMVGGSGFDPYRGVSASLLWDPAVLSYFGWDATGSVLPSPFCVGEMVASSTGPHNGVTGGEAVGCAAVEFSTTATGLAMTIVLTPATGCSPLHLLTLSPPDNDALGSATVDSFGASQVNTYGMIDVTVCGPATPAPVSVGGIAEQPDVSALPSATAPSGDHRTAYALGGILLATIIGAAGWYVRRRRTV